MGEYDPNLAEIEALIARKEAEKHDDAAMLAQLEEEEHAERTFKCFPDDDDGSDSGDKLPPPATEEEVEEARQIVQKAERDVREREKMKVKMVGATKDDLQAMINARLQGK